MMSKNGFNASRTRLFWVVLSDLNPLIIRNRQYSYQVGIFKTEKR